MLYTLSNTNLSITVNSIGAELKSIIQNGTEYMWQGSNNSWKRTSPILFPIVGALNDDRYLLENKEFNLTQHGFARDMDFTLEEETNNALYLSVESNSDTLRKFPFDFKLTLGYELLNNSIKVSYKVENKDNNQIYFSIGSHPGFNCPLDSKLSFTDYKLTFNKNENSTRRFKNDKVLTGERGDFLVNSNQIKLEHSLFKNGALIFDDLKSNAITLESDLDSKKLTMDFTGFPYFGIWSWPPEPADYICLEPWYGLDDLVNQKIDFKNKEGVLKLDKNKTFNAFYTLIIE